MFVLLSKMYELPGEVSICMPDIKDCLTGVRVCMPVGGSLVNYGYRRPYYAY